MLENAAVSFSWVLLCLKPKSKSIRNVPMTEILSILKESPKQSVHAQSSSKNPWESTSDQYYLLGFCMDKWPPDGC